MMMLAWVPFLTPLPNVQSNWLWLVIPLIFGISMMYKAIRVPTLDHYWRHVFILVAQVLGTFAALAIGFLIVVQFVVPLLPG